MILGHLSQEDITMTSTTVCLIAEEGGARFIGQNQGFGYYSRVKFKMFFVREFACCEVFWNSVLWSKRVSGRLQMNVINTDTAKRRSQSLFTEFWSVAPGSFSYID